MGTAILRGILSSFSEIALLGKEDSPKFVPNRLITCNTTPASAKRVSDALSHLASSLDIRLNDNVRSVQDADVVLLACKPYLVEKILTENGMRAALRNKLLISILAGVSAGQIENILYAKGSGEISDPDARCRVVRVMPNTAAVIRESMTVIATPSQPLSAEQDALVTGMFSKVGRVVHLPAQQMDASAALCGSGPAFYALFLEAMADGAVAMGIPRANAQEMAAQTMRGCAGMVLNGEHPAIVREKVSTPGGCTIGGLLVLEEGCVRGTVAKGVREATVVASQLGQGAQRVNGTRFR